ncbi:MAG: hypothetical protein P8Y99_15760 [Calditrichaceae bacterium]
MPTGGPAPMPPGNTLLVIEKRLLRIAQHTWGLSARRTCPATFSRRDDRFGLSDLLFSIILPLQNYTNF